MKINTIRVAGILTALCLATSCFVGGTIAKYTTSDDTSDSATVAKWGVELSASDSENIFNTAYGTTVVSSGSTKVVAPGTNGSLTGFTVSGSPEVAVKVGYVATVTLSDWNISSGENASEFYCPIKVTVNNEEVTKGDSASAYAQNIKNAIEACSKEYKPNTDLADTLDVAWSWEFEGEDANDTALANASSLDNISISVTATVEQINSLTETETASN